MNNKQAFIQEIQDLIDNNDIDLTKEQLAGFEEIKESNKSKAQAMTENGRKILMFMQNNYSQYDNVMKAKDIANGLSIGGRSVSGSIRKLITDGYVEKIGNSNPTAYAITTTGKSYNLDNE